MQHNTPQVPDANDALQQAACARILYFKKKFKDEGIDIRTGIELEFLVEDNNHTPQAGHVDTAGLKRWLHTQGLIRVADVLPERIVSTREVSAKNALQYEAKIGESEESLSDKYNPIRIADTVAILKSGVLAQALRCETCLRTPANASILLNPNFNARPYPNSEDPDIVQASSGMHINVSLYHDGENIFAGKKELMDHYANAVVAMQRDAGLSMLPEAKSLLRIGAHSNVPERFDVIARDHMDPDQGASVMLRFPNSDNPYIENRLPGADADPYVALAVTLAAMYDAYRHPGQREPVRGALPRERSTWVEALHSKETRLRDLLGDALYEQVQQRYGTETGATRG